MLNREDKSERQPFCHEQHPRLPSWHANMKPSVGQLTQTERAVSDFLWDLPTLPATTILNWSPLRPHLSRLHQAGRSTNLSEKLSYHSNSTGAFCWIGLCNRNVLFKFFISDRLTVLGYFLPIYHGLNTKELLPSATEYKQQHFLRKNALAFFSFLRLDSNSPTKREYVLFVKLNSSSVILHVLERKMFFFWEVW